MLVENVVHVGIDNMSRAGVTEESNSTRPFSKAEMFDELNNFILPQFFDELADWFDPDRVEALAGGNYHQFDCRSVSIGETLGWLYDYAIDAMLKEGDDPYLWLHSASLFVDEIVAPKSAFWGGGTRRPLCARVVETAMARWELDMAPPAALAIPNEIPGTPSGYLTIRQVALLANMDEKSVRNATYEKSDDRLRTSIRGGRAYVEVIEARRWLARRRGYRATQLVPRRAAPGTEIPAAGFRTPEEVGAFVEKRREALGIDRAEVARRIGQTGVTAQTVELVEAGGVCDFQLSTLMALGRALEVDPKRFALAAAHGYIIDDYREDTV